MTDYKFTQLFNTIALNMKEITRGEFNEKKQKFNKLADGQEFQGYHFPDWQTNTDVMNYTPSSEQGCAPVLGAVIEAPLIFFDFDTADYYDLVMHMMTPDELLHCYNARGVDTDGNTTGGHLGFRITEDMVMHTLGLGLHEIEMSHYNDTALKLFTHKADHIDIQFGGGQLIFLASSGNKTKELVTCPNKVEDFVQVPKVLEFFIQSLLYKKGVKPLGEVTPSNFENRTFYYNKVRDFLASKTHTAEEEFFKDFMPLDYQKKLSPKPHPDKLEDIGESAHDFLLSCSTKLGGDPSIDMQTYEEAMFKINQVCRPSKTPTDLKSQIIDRMITGKANVDGIQIWQHNEDWDKISLSFANRQTGDSYTVFLDPENTLTPYLMINNTKADHTYLNIKQLREIYSSFTGNKPSNVQEKPLPIETIRSKTIQYGLSEDGRKFNTYRMSKAMEIVLKPSLGDDYADPVDFIKYTKNLMPEHDIWEWVMRFWYTKLLTDDFSSVILYFDGMSGSGKSIFFKMMAVTMGWKEFNPGAYHVVKEDLARDKYDPYMAEASVVVIEEIGDWSDQKLAQKKANDCKTASSTKEYSLRLPGGATPKIEHKVTFGFTSNTPIALFKELNQRRLAFIYTPKSLTEIWTEQEAGDLTTKWFDDYPIETACSIAAWMTRNLTPLNDYEYRNVPKVIQESEAAQEYFQMTAKKDTQILKALLGVEMRGIEPLLELLNCRFEDIHMTPRYKGPKLVPGYVLVTIRTDGELTSHVDNSIEALAFKQNIDFHNIFPQLMRAKVIKRIPNQNRYVMTIKGDMPEKTEELNIPNTPTV